MYRIAACSLSRMSDSVPHACAARSDARPIAPAVATVNGAMLRVSMLTARIEVMEVGLQAIALHEEALSKRMLAGVQQVCCKLPVV